MNLLVPVKRGSIKIVRVSHDAMRDFVRLMGKPADLELRALADYYDPTSIEYCYNECLAWLVNRELAAGMVLIGTTSDAWIFTERKNLK
jgi:hypothetical protein